MKRIMFLNLVIMLIWSCNNKPDNIERTLSEEEKIEIQKTNELSMEEGLLKLQSNCYSCHNPNSESHEAMLAPPLAGIKHNYLKSYPDKELFIAQMSDYVFNPTKENSMIKGPVKRFGLMPKTTLSHDEIQELCLFIFNNKLEVPNWFPEHFQEMHNKKWDE